MITITLVQYSLVVAVVIAIALGAVLALTSRPRGPGYAACGRCRYDVGATLGQSATCPECGTPLFVAGVRTRLSQRRNITALVLGIMLGGLGVAGGIAMGMQKLTRITVRDEDSRKAPPLPVKVLPIVSYQAPLPTKIHVPLDNPTQTLRIDSLSRLEALELLSEVTKARKRATDETTKQFLKGYFDALMMKVRSDAASSPPVADPVADLDSSRKCSDTDPISQARAMFAV
jgi:hypothetical protein